MKLALRYTIATAAAVLAVMAIHYYRQRLDHAVLFEADHERHMGISRALQATIEAVWTARGEEVVRQLVEEANRRTPAVELRYVVLPSSGDPRYANFPPEVIGRVLQGQTVSVEQKDAEGKLRRHTFLPLSVPASGPVALGLSESMEAHGSFVWRQKVTELLTALLLVTVCGFVATGTSIWFVGRPLRLLQTQLRAIGAGELGSRISLQRRDEIGELAAELDAMCERIVEERLRMASETEARIATLEQLRHTDRLTTMGQLASGVAHELGTPLNIVAARAKMIESEGAAAAEVAGNARVIQEQAARMTAIIRQLLDFSRRQGPKLGVANLKELVSRTLNLLEPLAQKSGVKFDLRSADELLLAQIDQNQVQQALTNIVMNGIQAMPKGGRLKVSLAACRARLPSDPTAPEGEYVSLVVEDEGQGIGRDHLGQIFEPFFTTKGIGEGTGLGLSVAYGIVQEHGGWIAVESEIGKGSRFTVYLARAAGAGSAAVEVAS